MPALVLDIADLSLPLPEFLVLDASLVLELTPNRAFPHRYHSLAVNFLSRLRTEAQAGRVKPLLPLLAFEECYFKLCQRVLSAAGEAAHMPWHAYYKQNPHSIRGLQPVLQTLYEALLAFPIEVTEPEDLAVYPKGTEPLLADRISTLITAFSVLPKDATILSEAERLGVFHVATLDSDWRRADGFTVFAPR